MKKQPKYKQLTQTEYAAAKWMLTNKNKTQVAKELGRSRATITYINRSTSYENYREILADLNERSKANKAAKAKVTQKYSDPVATPPPVQDKAPEILFAHIESIHNILKAHTTMLNALNDKLDLVAVPKRRLF